MATDELKAKVERSLKKAFSATDDQVEVERTRTARISASIVSGSFSDQPMEERQQRIWDHLRGSLAEGEIAEVVFTLALSPFEVPDDDIDADEPDDEPGEPADTDEDE